MRIRKSSSKLPYNEEYRIHHLKPYLQSGIQVKILPLPILERHHIPLYIIGFQVRAKSVDSEDVQDKTDLRRIAENKPPLSSMGIQSM
ncbi:hypothetical protein NPIL_124691 [Nephila pilipes]|uniref:Uncharacterized protein n=1 Tax=Nephila pilipes TaxID=299642 RepID=A0A8X6TB28_NEPPI|nr:hypothetical protein NPIL_124691 [Nephila pilipes]